MRISDWSSDVCSSDLNSADADDFVQESLIRALTYVKDGGTIQNWRAYLYRILRNVRADHVGRQARYGPAVMLDDVEHQLAVPAPQPSELLLRELGDALDKLPSTQRHVVNRIAVDGLSYQDAADRPGIRSEARRVGKGCVRQ